MSAYRRYVVGLTRPWQSASQASSHSARVTRDRLPSTRPAARFPRAAASLATASFSLAA